MIVFVQPVTGHASNSNGWPPSCGITTMLCIIGVGSACPSCTSLTWSSFVRPSRTVVVDRRLVAGSMVGVVHHCTCRESFAVSVGFYIRFCSALFSTEITYHAACGTCVSRVPSFTLGTATTALVRWTLPSRLAVNSLLVVPFQLPLFFIIRQTLTSKSSKHLSSSSWGGGRSCSVGIHRTSSDGSVPMTTWAKSAFCHNVAILIRSSNLGLRSCSSFRCNPESYMFRRSSSWSQSFGVISWWEHSCPFCSFRSHQAINFSPLLFARDEVVTADDHHSLSV